MHVRRNLAIYLFFSGRERTENGCPWDKVVCTDAVLFGHYDVLQWAIANGCPYSKKGILKYNHIPKELKEWISQQEPNEPPAGDEDEDEDEQESSLLLQLII